MVMNYKEVPGQFPEDAARYAEGISQVEELVERLGREGKLPARFGENRTPVISAASTTVEQFQRFNFSDRAREGLRREGYEIFPLTGRSIASFLAEGKPMRTTWGNRYPGLDSATSRRTEVAIKPNPDIFFLLGSHEKTLAEQQEMINRFSEKLEQRIPGVKAVMGTAHYYIELFFRCFDRRINLLGRRHARTITSDGSGGVIAVGYGLNPSRPYEPSSKRLVLGISDPTYPEAAVHAAPLIVPTDE